METATKSAKEVKQKQTQKKLFRRSTKDLEENVQAVVVGYQ